MKIEKIADELTNMLLADGFGNKASRLVLETGSGNHLGARNKESLHQLIFDYLSSLSDDEIYTLGAEHSEAYQAGYDSVINKPNKENYNIRYFSSPKNMKDWERGKKKAESEIANKK